MPICWATAVVLSGFNTLILTASLALEYSGYPLITGECISYQEHSCKDLHSTDMYTDLGLSGGGQLYQHVLHILTCRSDVYDSWGKPKTDSKSSVVERVCASVGESC